MQKCRKPSCFDGPPIRATVTCTCRVSAAGLKLITSQCFDNMQNVLGIFFGTVSAIAEALFAEREIDERVRFRVIFSTFNFRLADSDISIKNKKYQYFER